MCVFECDRQSETADRRRERVRNPQEDSRSRVQEGDRTCLEIVLTGSEDFFSFYAACCVLEEEEARGVARGEGGEELTIDN